ncbi:hypothetical protein Dimus_008402 [Dionaea muscipula]
MDVAPHKPSPRQHSWVSMLHIEDGIRFLRQANPVDRMDGNRSTSTFGASLPGCVFLQGRHAIERMRGGMVDRLLEARPVDRRAPQYKQSHRLPLSPRLVFATTEDADHHYEEAVNSSMLNSKALEAAMNISLPWSSSLKSGCPCEAAVIHHQSLISMEFAHHVYHMKLCNV